MSNVERYRLIRNVKTSRDVDEAIKKLPDGAKVKSIVPQRNIPASFAIIYVIEKEKKKMKPHEKIGKPKKLARPRAPPKPKRVSQFEK